jgi:hypothetical protein
MAGMSTYLADALLSWIKSTAMPSDPAAVYVALFNGDPTDAGSGGSEVTTSVRVAGRVAVTFGAITGTGPRSMANSADVSFGNSANAVASITHFAVFDAASAGNMLMSEALDVTIAIAAGQLVKFETGALVVNAV